MFACLLASHRFVLRLGLLVIASTVFYACSGPAAVEPPPAPTPVVEAEPAGPPFAILYSDREGVHRLDASNESITTLRTTSVQASRAMPAPQGDAVALVYQTPDSTTLMLLDGADERWLHSVAGEAVYTLAWTASGDALAFGFYTPVQEGDVTKMGAGGVRTVTLDGSVENVGCSASKAVHVWLPNGDLVTGNDDNHYVVDAQNCATKSTFPLRKRRAVQYAPGGEHMSYIFRDLVYNRERRAYEPESTLFVAELGGLDEERLMTDRFRARNMAWSPDGTQLAFDVRSPDNEAIRQVAIHDVTRGQTSYLIPPADGQEFSDTRAVWSPAGGRMVFDRAYPDGTLQKVVYTTLNLQSRVVAVSDAGAGAIRTVGWADDDTLVLGYPDGSTHVLDLRQQEPFIVDGTREVLHVQVQR